MESTVVVTGEVRHSDFVMVGLVVVRHFVVVITVLVYMALAQ